MTQAIALCVDDRCSFVKKNYSRSRHYRNLFYGMMFDYFKELQGRQNVSWPEKIVRSTKSNIRNRQRLGSISMNVAVATALGSISMAVVVAIASENTSAAVAIEMKMMN